MADDLTTRPAHDLIKGVVTTLGSGKVFEKVVASVDAAFELARQTAIAATGKKDAAPVITSVEVTVRDRSAAGESPPVKAIFDKREPVDAGPKRRVPIACGGGSCWTVCVLSICVTVCITWEC